MAAAPPPPGWAPYPPGMVPMPTQRVRQNLQPLGILWCVFGVYRLFSIIMAGFVLHTLAANGVFEGMPFAVGHAIQAFWPLILIFTTATSAASVFVGYALLTRRPWARVLAIVLGILVLIKIPFGTGLGIYTLWVLAPQASGAEWDAITGVRS